MKLTEEQFQEKVLADIGSMRTSTETLLKDFTRLDGDTKKAMEDLTKVKNDSNANADEFKKAMAKMNLQLGRELRMANGMTPVQRIARDPELRRAFRTWLCKSLDIVAHAKDLDEASTPGSTGVLNPAVEQEIYDALLTYGAYKTLDVRTIGTKAVDIRLKTARLLATFIDEAAQIGADSTKAGSKATVTPKKLAALISISSELLEDDAMVVEDVMNDFLEAFAYKLDWIGFTADGTADATDGGFTGMFYGGTTVTAAGTHTTIGATVYTDWLLALTGVDPAVLQRAARWWLHPTLLAAAIGVKDGNGRPIFQTALEAPSFGGIGSIFGFPVTLVGAAPSTNSASQKIACFGDPKAQAIRIRRDLRVDRSEQWAFDTDEITFRGTLRAASKTRLATAITVLTLPGS